MGNDVSILISAKDNFTQAITTMQNSTRSFSKDLEGTKAKLEALNKTKAVLTVDTKKTRDELNKAQKQFNKTGDAADKLNAELASANYDNASRNLRLISKNAKEAEKDLVNMGNASSKLENRAGAGIGKSASVGSVISGLATSGLINMVGQSLSEVAGTMVSSKFGDDSGSVFSSSLSGTASGAAMGATIGSIILTPGVGTAIGAAVGGVIGTITGGISGANKIYEKEDDFFKDKVRTQYTEIAEEQQKKISSGSTTAASREQDKISFSTLLKGSENADEYISDMVDFAAHTPFTYDTVKKASQNLLAYGYKQNELIDQLGKIGNAGAALGMSSEDMSMVATGLGRMKSSGKSKLEYVNLLQERGIDAIGIMAQEKGVSKGDIYEKISKGKIDGEWAAKVISDAMGETFAGTTKMQSETFTGLQSTLEDLKNEINAATGSGYNEERKKGIKKEVEFLDGESGEELKKANGYIGQYYASMENKKTEFVNNRLKIAMKSNEYEIAKAAGDGAEVGKIIALAKADAENSFVNSTEYQTMIKSQTDTVNEIRNKANESGAWQSGYEYEKNFTKGRKAAADGEDPPNPNDYDENGNYITHYEKGLIAEKKLYAITNKPPIADSKTSGYTADLPLIARKKSYATGINRVPYDGFLASLHEGEKVIPASLARNSSGSCGTNVVVTGNNFTIREEADINKIAVAIASNLSRQYALQ